MLLQLIQLFYTSRLFSLETTQIPDDATWSKVEQISLKMCPIA